MRRGDLLAVVALAVALRLVAAWAIPLGFGPDFNCAPDEAGHFWVARELARGHTATWPESASIYSAYPPSQYAPHVAFAALARHVDPPWLYRMPLAAERVRGYPLVRLGSVVLGAVTVVALALATAAWTGSRRAGLVAGAVGALYPQLVFVGAYTNGDAYTIAAGALLALALAYWGRDGEATAGLVAVGAAAGAVLLGKPSGYALLPPTAVWVAWSAIRGRSDGRRALRAAAVAALVAAPVLAWNAVRNGGDALGLDRYRQFLAGPYRPRAVATVADPVTTFVQLLASSAFGRFANMSRPLPDAYLVLAYALLAAGLAAALARRPAAATRTARGALWLATSCALSVALVAYNSWRIDFQPQGRYLLLPIVIVTIVAAEAPRALGSRFWRAWPLAYVAFLAVAAVETEVLLYRYPCG